MPRASSRQIRGREHRSPGFRLIAHHLRTEHKQNVLELGPAVTQNIEFLSALQCKIYVENLTHLLEKLNAPKDNSDEDSKRDGMHQVLSFSTGLYFDVVLAWDLLNYLGPPALQTLVTRLIPFCARETLLFALICTGKQQSDAPLAFEIAATDRLRYKAGTEQLRASPQYSTPFLLKMLRGFTLVRSFLLQNNMQEYVFRFE